MDLKVTRHHIMEAIHLTTFKAGERTKEAAGRFDICLQLLREQPGSLAALSEPIRGTDYRGIQLYEPADDLRRDRRRWFYLLDDVRVLERAIDINNAVVNTIVPVEFMLDFIGVNPALDGFADTVKRLHEERLAVIHSSVAQRAS